MENQACEDCCRQSGKTYVLPEAKRSFTVAGECCDCMKKKALPVKEGSEVHQYQLLAYADGPEGSVCVEPATGATDPTLYAGFAMHCFGAMDKGGVTFLAEGGFAVDMAVMPDGFVWNAATISQFAARGLCPEVVHGLEV